MYIVVRNLKKYDMIKISIDNSRNIRYYRYIACFIVSSLAKQFVGFKLGHHPKLNYIFLLNVDFSGSRETL